MINFKKYSSIDNVITRDFMERVWAGMQTDLEWVVQEKVHGANTSFLCDGEEVRFAKRTSILSEDDKFYDFQSLLEAYKQRVMSLFKRILSAQRFNQEHERCREFIERSVERSNAKHIIVATHHVPSFELMADEFKGSPINGAFTSELGDYIASSRIEYWIYGHSHRNINKAIGNTRCICNQLGYTFHGEQPDFRRDAIIEINDNELQV